MPRRALLAGTVVGYLSVIAAYVSPGLIFAFLVNSYGAVALFVYLIIAVSQVRRRRRLGPEGEAQLSLRMWLFPWLSYLTIALMVVAIAAMAVLPDTRSQFWLSLVTLAVVLVGFEVRRRKGAPLSAGRRSTVDPGLSAGWTCA